MTLRPARHADTLAIVDILVDAQMRSRYADLVAVDEPYARKLISSLIQRHGGTNDGAAFVMVSEREDGAVEAFVAGVLGRVYSIGDMLSAQDCFLIGLTDCPARVLVELFDAYVAWAAANPKVFEIGASCNDAIPGSENFETTYRRRGFVECARTYRRERHASDGGDHF